ncbi:MAG: hypothetical protein ABJK37_19145 [Paraglaciecola sp.]|uniref:PKD domain-containing protein n=1 Tax=Paraglaciecola sp. TaxID=1920173 RepID=UPI0032996ABB
MKLPFNEIKERLNNCGLNLYIPIVAIGLSACGGGGGDSSSGGQSQKAGNPPTVTVDARQIVSVGEAVTLTASATDPDADTISYSWQQLNGDSVANTQGFDTASASFNAPDDVNSIQFRVTATAGGQSDSDTITLVVVEDVNTAVFVDANFAGTSTGSIDAPYTDFSQAVEQSSEDADFYLQTPDAQASYALWHGIDVSARPRLSGGNSIYGGYNDDWHYDPQNNPTPLTAERVGLIFENIDQPSKVAGVALQVAEQVDTDLPMLGIYVEDGASEFTLENSIIKVDGFAPDSAMGNFGYVVGAYFDNVNSTYVKNNQITTGDGRSTANMAIRPNTTGADGNDGEDGRVGLNIVGGDGGAGSEGWNGGKGGDAGNSSFETGKDGVAGSGRTSAPFVSGGSGGIRGFSNSNDGKGGAGENGDNGARGNPGNGATGWGTINNSGAYVTSNGERGSTGYSGAGGGGGGGGAGGSFGQNGGAGGGGGEGGGGGTAGYGGRSGGASIALHIVAGTLNEIIGNTLVSGNGGNGGRGGLGSDGGEGGSGGEGDPGNLSGGEGGDGGDGGKGGEGGVGGSGAGGPSFGIFIGVFTPAKITDNDITTGTGGNGSEARFSNEDDVAAGEGGWSYGVFDVLTTDNFSVELSGNTYNIGSGGEHGGTKEGTGQSGNSNVE